MTTPGPSEPLESADVFPSRRALRAQREAEQARADAASAGGSVGSSDAAVAVPSVVPLAPAVATPVAPRLSAAPSLPAARRTATAPRTAAARRAGGRSPATVLAAVLAIPALILTAGLPAYAFAPQSVGEANSATAAHLLSKAGAQSLHAGGATIELAVARDGFSATSEEELVERAAQLQRETAAAAARESAAKYAASGIRADGDDYPWPFEATDTQGGGLSPLGYYYRECVDFVAWRLNRDAGIGSGAWRWTWNSMTPGGGDASSWAGAWSAKGWATSTTPVVGAVAWFNYNHVAYVRSVSGDTVVLEEYNWMGSHAYHSRTVRAGDVPLYLYPPS